MTEILKAALVLFVLLGSSGLGRVVYPLLSERHRSREVIDFVRLVIAMLVTFAALVLGLLTTSVKASYDKVGSDLSSLSISLIQLDQCLREWGEDAVPIRKRLRAYGNRVGNRHPSPTLGLSLQSQMNSREPVPRNVPSIQ